MAVAIAGLFVWLYWAALCTELGDQVWSTLRQVNAVHHRLHLGDYWHVSKTWMTSKSEAWTLDTLC